jgi:hypothetical protein
LCKTPLALSGFTPEMMHPVGEQKYDDEALFANFDWRSGKDECKSQHHDEPLSFDLQAFLEAQRASAQPQATASFGTPFDSPEPLSDSQPGAAPCATLTTIVETEGSPATVCLSTDRLSAPRTLAGRQRSFSMDEAFAPDSIFHAAAAAAALPPAPATTRAQPSKSSAFDFAPIVQGSSSADPFAEAVIPDIAFSARRASEPTLGSRRLALAAATAAANNQVIPSPRRALETTFVHPGAPTLGIVATTPRGNHTAATAGLQARPQPAHIDVGGTLSVKAASDVNIAAGPFAASTNDGCITPRKGCSQCSSLCVASGLCSTHLLAQFEPGTPTTVARGLHRLWRRKAYYSGARLQLLWEFYQRGEKWQVVLQEEPFSRARSVLVNGVLAWKDVEKGARPVKHHGSVERRGDEWKLSMVLGRSRSSSFELILAATPKKAHHAPTGQLLPQSWHYDSPFTHELWVNGFYFTEAQNKSV